MWYFYKSNAIRILLLLFKGDENYDINNYTECKHYRIPSLPI